MSSIKQDTKLSPDDHANLISFKNRRFRLLLLIMMGFSGIIYMRTNVAYGIPCMLNSTANALLEQQDRINQSLTHSFAPPETCSAIPSSTGGVVDYGGTIIWTSSQQAIVFSAAFFGATAGVIVSTPIVHRLPPNIFLLIATIVMSIASLLFPFSSTQYGFMIAIGTRLILGFAETFVHPSLTGLQARWFTNDERAKSLGVQNTGLILAMVFGPIISGFFCDSVLKWQTIFYFSGALGLFWCMLWFIFSSGSPHKDKRISAAEREYLATKVPPHVSSKDCIQTPWRAILTSPAFWAICSAQFTLNFYTTFIQVYIPTFFKEVFYLGVQKNGFFNAIPYILNGASNLGYPYLLDYLKRKTHMNNNQGVIFSQTLANFGAGSCFVFIACFADCSFTAYVMAGLCFSAVFLGMFGSGMFMSMTCIAPTFTATICSISLIFAMLGRLALPFLVLWLRKTGSPNEWMQIILVVAAVQFCSAITFYFFGSSEVEEWARLPGTSQPMVSEEGKEAPAISAPPEPSLFKSPFGFASELTASVMSIDGKY